MARIEHNTTGVATVATVTLDADYDSVEVLNRGENEIFFRVDGVDPAVDGDDAYIVAAGQWLEVPVPGRARNTEVRLISSGATEYTVTGVL